MGYRKSTRPRALLGIIIALTFSELSFAGNNNPSVYWYLNGTKQVWTPEPGKVTLHVNGFVDHLAGASVESVGDDSYIHLQLPTDEAESLEYLSNLKKQYPASHLTISFIDATGKEVSVDERLFISFRNEVSDDEIQDLATRYGLQLENPRPAYLQAGWQYVYIFSQKEFSVSNNTVTLSAQIYENESDKVIYANPDRVAMPGQDFKPDGTINDPDLVYTWLLNNYGQALACSATGGASGADAKVEDAWNLGYTGQGIKVGVVDFGGFDYTHPDMQGQFLPGWNCVTDSAYDAENAPYDSTFLGHGMAVSGIIGAAGNNGIGSAGVAYGAKLVPFFVNGQEDVQLILAMQQAAAPAFDVDILNFSLGIDHPSDAIQTQISNLATYGRVRNGIAQGVVMVASHGNDGEFDGTNPQWPAAYPQVISVGASTPDDELKVTTDNWNLGDPWASNYGNLMSVIAPGVCIFTTDMTGNEGYGTSDYVAFGETSAAAPIVAGVAALLLSKNQGLNYAQVKNAITSGADKVHPDIYNYSENDTLPGHNEYAGYGRVNAFNALNNVATGITSETVVSNNYFTIGNPVESQMSIRYQLPGNVNQVTMEIYDISGKLLMTDALQANANSLSVNMEEYASGMYLARFVNMQDGLMKTVKFIKD